MLECVHILLLVQSNSNSLECDTNTEREREIENWPRERFSVDHSYSNNQCNFKCKENLLSAKAYHIE